MLSGMHAATSQYVVSSTMARLLVCQSQTRFQFSHNFTDLLVGQKEATLKGEPVNFCIQVNRHRKKNIAWKDSLSNDYIHRPVGENMERILRTCVRMKSQGRIRRNISPSVKWQGYKKM